MISLYYQLAILLMILKSGLEIMKVDNSFMNNAGPCKNSKLIQTWNAKRLNSFARNVDDMAYCLAREYPKQDIPRDVFDIFMAEIMHGATWAFYQLPNYQSQLRGLIEMVTQNDHPQEGQWQFVLHWLARWGEFLWDQNIADTVVSLSHTREQHGDTIDLSTTRRLDIRIRKGFKLVDQTSSSMQILPNAGTGNKNLDEVIDEPRRSMTLETDADALNAVDHVDAVNEDVSSNTEMDFTSYDVIPDPPIVFVDHDIETGATEEDE